MKAERRLKRLQKRVSRKVKGSKNRRKARYRLARMHEKVANQRKDFLHKESRKIADNYGLIGVEDLKIRNMLRNHCLAKHISDASWGRFLQMIGYKAESANALFVAVDPRGTTGECSGCGAMVPKDPSDRIHDCPECGLVLPRDHNSARIIKKRAEHTVGHTGIHACGDTASTGSSGLVNRLDGPASGVAEAGTIYDNGSL
jgi:putative transposase